MSLNEENKIEKDSVENNAQEVNTEKAVCDESVKADDNKELTKATESTIFAKHTYNTKKPAKNGNIKRLIICAVAVLLCGVLVAGIILIKDMIPEKKNESFLTASVADEDKISLLKKEEIVKPSTTVINGEEVSVDTNIESVYFINGYDEFIVKPYFVEAEKKDATSSASTSSSAPSYKYDTKWYVEGIDKELTVSTAIADKVKECLTLNAFKEIENNQGSVEEYHKYFGMKEKLTAGFVVKFSDGTEDLTVTVGMPLLTGEAYYVLTSLSDTVYAVKNNFAERYFCSTKEFADSTVIEPIVQTDANKDYFNQNGTLARFDKIKLSGEVFGNKTYEFGMSTGVSADYMPYKMTAPYNRPASDEFVGKILNIASKGLNATALYSYKITDKDIKECGFDKPKCVVELTVKDYSYKLVIGGSRNDETESMTAMIEGKTQAFGIKVDDIAFLVNVSNDITKMFNQSFIREDIYTIKNFTIKTAEVTNTFNLTHTLRAGETDIYDTVIKKGDTVMQTQSFKLIYQRVLMLSLMEFVTEANRSNTVLTVTFDYIDGSASKVVEFTESPDDIYHYVAWVDGTPLGEILKTSLDDVIKCLEIYLEGGEVPDVW